MLQKADRLSPRKSGESKALLEEEEEESTEACVSATIRITVTTQVNAGAPPPALSHNTRVHVNNGRTLVNDTLKSTSDSNTR